ncbi:uncharacterized protein [Aegilops tauschii subsp. strangulata]|uniref:uncharacterized protein isoform X5 n=1 Tax=Aegilops tauschii subsp. strangulata TaxID=200361 RepID=UPI00098BAC20|nr:uncharacterized protein LOC109786679 isoform X7 [Aegilops tauschii subsp. strangulata]
MHACVPDLEHASGLVGFSLCPDLKGVPLSVSCSGPCTNAVPSHYEDDPWLVADDHLRGRFMAGWGWSVPSHCEEMIHGQSGMVTCARRPTLILDLERGMWPTMPEDAELLFGNVIIRGPKKQPTTDAWTNHASPFLQSICGEGS